MSDIPFIHPLAVVDAGAKVGARTRVWAFAHAAPGAVIGEDCNICDHTFIEGGVRLHDRVTVKCGVYLWTGVTAENDVFIGPAVAFSNDLWPRSRQHPSAYSSVLLREGCSIGANSTILPVVIGRWAMIGAGSVVTRDVPDHALIVGNPGRITGWVCRCAKKLEFEARDRVTCGCGRTFERLASDLIRETSVPNN